MRAALLLCLLAVSARADGRPPEWAQPVTVEGVDNLHRVTPTLYRSRQPTRAGMANLEKLGVRTVINLRAFDSDTDEIAGTGLREVHVGVLTWWVRDKHVVAVLKALRRREDGPFLIHCQHGADRTGLMVAMFRLVEQGWTKEAALKELREGGYGFHAQWKNIVRYIEKVDVARMKARVDAP
ncbi:protein-tyrosine-phosphatase [bacterium]|nr:MAG: protein-tyrosine-phosphatase [bacterium]